MRRKVVRSVVVGAAVLCCMAIGLFSTPAIWGKDETLQTEEKSLRERVQQLEDRVQELEKMLERQPTQPVLLLQQAPAIQYPIAPQGAILTAPAVPHDWKQSEINGVPFYTLPLKSGETSDE
ncbi:MAG: hypothetical protein R3C11_15570 [Planctomycetaceae bacterium]